MRERLLTLTLACLAGALLVALLLAGQGTPRVARPTTAAAGGDGYRAAQQWLAAAHIRVRPQRVPWDGAGHTDNLPATGNLLIVTVPSAVPFAATERRALARWVSTGNTLLVLAALSDAPEWAGAGAPAAARDAGLLTGLTFEEDAAQVPRSPARRSLVGAPGDPWLEGVTPGVLLSGHAAHRWHVLLPHDAFVLVLARDRGSGGEMLWATRQGRGRILVAAAGSLFSDRALHEAGNARLLANLVSLTVGPAGAVIFDDFHQGLADLYDPARFYRDPRLHRTLLVLLAVWLAFVLGGAPLRAAPQVAPPPEEADLVRATGRMLARVLPAREGARGLIEHFLGRLRRRPCGAALPPQGAAPWHWLEAHVPPADLAQLRAWDEAARGARRAPLARQTWLVRLHNLIQRLERQLGP